MRSAGGRLGPAREPAEPITVPSPEIASDPLDDAGREPTRR